MFKKTHRRTKQSTRRFGKKTKSALPFALWRDARPTVHCGDCQMSNALRCACLSRVTFWTVSLLSAASSPAAWWNLQETKNISHTRHGTCDAAFGFSQSDEKFREIFALLWVSCRVCVNAFLRYFFLFTFLLQCSLITVLWNRFGCLGVVLLHMYVCMYFFKVIDSSMKLFAWFKLTTVVGCWKHRLEITKVLLFFR